MNPRGLEDHRNSRKCSVRKTLQFLFLPSHGVRTEVGLTGRIATSKSTVPNLLSSAHDVPIVDADIIARQVVEPERPGSRRYRQHSKNEVLHPTCVGCAALDRRSSLEMGRLGRCCLPVSSFLYFYQINLICLT